MRALAAAAALILATAFGPGAAAQEGGLSVELNKLEDIDNGCRSFFLFRNRTGAALTGFEMSLAILDVDGVIDRLLTIDAAPLPANRTTLKLFEIPQIACGQIQEILLHDIAACRAEGGGDLDCFSFLALSSRAKAQLVM